MTSASQPDSADDKAGSADLRCPCGRLLARTTLVGIELKCARCKRTILLRWLDLIACRELLTHPETED